MSSSPAEDGPCEDFYEQPYYKKMKEALRPGGIHCALGEDWREGEGAEGDQ